MLNILNRGYTDILQLFYTDKCKSIHLRDIAKLTKYNENSVYRFLNKLEKDNILKSRRQANLKLFSLKQNKKVYSILSFFDVEKYEKLPHIRKTALKCYFDALEVKPIFAILFGSTAKENFREDSDIDILLITNSRIDTKKAEYAADTQSAMKVSTFQMTYKNFLKELKLKDDKVVQSAVHTGYPLINHIQYYEVIFNETI
ncbi:MAG: nucleotidyltransferase domain-containing protein [Candidatus Woesearchaeota archaeon]|jgi:predicted nucleotidyltransferase